MRRQLSRVLLGGAIVAAAMTASPLLAQNPHAMTALKCPLDIAITYNVTRANVVTGNSFWMQGGSVQVHGQFYRGLGLVADVVGMHSGNMNSSGVGLDILTATFGPRYTWSPAHRKCAFFAQALVGEANGFNSVFPTTTGAVGSSSSLAVKTGGGLNIALAPRIALRAFEADWLRTQLPNSTTNVQNNVQLVTGIVFRFR